MRGGGEGETALTFKVAASDKTKDKTQSRVADTDKRRQGEEREGETGQTLGK